MAKEVQLKQTSQSESQNPKGDKANLSAEEELKKFSFFTMFRFASTTERLLMVLGVIGSICDGAGMPLFALFIGDVPDSLGGTGDPDEMIRAAARIALKFTYVAVGMMIGGYIGYSCWMSIGEKQGIEIRRRYFSSLLHQDIAFYDSINPNELSIKISEECFNIQAGIGEKVATFCQAMSTLVTGLVIGYIKGWQLALVMTGFMPVMGIAGSMFVFCMQKLTMINNDAYSKAGAISEEVLNAIRTVASLTGQKKETKKYDKVLNENSGPIAKYAILTGVTVGLIVLAIYGVYALGFFIGSIFIKNDVYNPSSNGGYTAGDVLIVFFAINMASFAPTLATPCAKAFAIAKANAVKAFKIIDRQSKISIADPRGLKPTSIQGNIKFRDVVFAYPGKPDRIILNGVSFAIRRNEKTAFVGESGCGKTTCMQLIERFYDIESGNGSIALDGNELKDLNLKWMRENIGYVGQEPVLFATSIKENLKMAKEDATDAEIWDALKKANAADFVQGLPQKLNTFVGNNGTQLSGGQKQRLAIARAILKNPAILLLDEATSALDRKNEMEIQKTLDEISEGRTTIVIAHRLSTIINADHIIVFDQGKIVEEGNHGELVAKKGKYYSLQHLQLTTQEKENENIQEENKSNKQIENIPKTKGQKTEQDPKKEETDNQVQIVVDDAGAPEKTKKQKINDEHSKMTLFQICRRLFSYNKSDVPLIFLGITGAIIYGCSFPLIAVIISNILVVFLSPEAEDFSSRAGLFSGLFLLNAVVAWIAVGLQFSTFNLVAERLSRRVRSEVFKKYVRMPIGWFDEPENSPAALGSRLATDATLINTLTSSVFGTYLQAGASFLTGVIISFIAEWRLALIGLACAPLLIFFGLARALIHKKSHDSGGDAYQESIAFASEAVNNMRTVASFGKEHVLFENYAKKLDGPLKTALKSAQVSGLALGAIHFVEVGSAALSFYTGTIFMRDYGLSFLYMYMSIMAILYACNCTSNALQFAPDAGAAQNAAINIFRILDTKPAIDIDDPRQNVKTPIKGDIEFRNVWFKYPSRERQIFKNFNLKIKASQKVAFVGPSGCGKSTILALLQRFYDVDQGEILIDGVNIKNYDLNHLRESYGVVSQEPVLFNGTIEYNIKYSKEDATDQEMRDAAIRASAIGFIENNEFEEVGDDPEAAKKFGTGFQRKVGPKGGQMSGGQKQRIAIARAILKNPSVLILDEATSALDAENEKAVQAALDKIMSGKTSLIVAHRISTIRDADEILVFSEGEIVERGNYQQLTDMKGVFYKLERGTNTGEAR